MRTVEEKNFESIIDLIIESWRLNRFTKNLAEKINDNKIQKKSVNQITRFEKHFNATLETLNLKVLDFTGQIFETGLPILPINLEDFNADDILIVEMMFEPTIKKGDTAEIIKKGAAVLKKRSKK